MTREDIIKIRDKVDAMNKDLGNTELFNTNPPITEIPSTEEPGTEAPATEDPGTEAPETDVPPTGPPSTEAPTTDPPKEEEEEYILSTTSPTTLPPIEIEDQDFIGDRDPYAIMNDKEELNKLLNTVYRQGLNAARDVVGESVLQSIPSVVGNTIDTNTKLLKLKDQFYQRNPDLEPFKKVVAEVYQETLSENPGERSMSKLLDKTAEETRKRLELYKKAVKDEQQSDVRDSDPPPLPNRRQGGKTTQTKRPSRMQSQIDKMNEALGRSYNE